MKTQRLVAIAVLGLLAMVALSARLNAADRQSGTWKMNPAKSKYNGPAPKSATLKVESDANGIKVDSQGVGANGQPLHTQFEVKYDGKDYPAAGLPMGDHISVKRIDANTIQFIMKNGSQPVMIVTSVVSADGKTRTSTYTSKDAQGHEVHTVVVYDKE